MSFVCQSCGHGFEEWRGQCPSCRAWNSVIEERLHVSDDEAEPRREDAPDAVASTQVQEEEEDRIPTGIRELDRVMGGGLVAGSINLLCGSPGAGKSTLALQAMASLAKSGERALYASGEESLKQVTRRAGRLKIKDDNLLLLSTTELEDVFAAIEKEEPSAVVIDSVQTMRARGLESSAGTVSQLREVAAQVVACCKEKDIASFLIGHVTKDGSIAGPKVLEHLVDATFAFEGDRNHSLRMLRADKNRFGSTNEVGVFEMTALGMSEVASPSALLLAERWEDAPGSSIVATCEGTRSMLVEVQALVNYERGAGRKSVNGVDASRLNMIMAVLRDVIPGIADVFLNLAGGARVDDPGMDLGVAIAMVSSFLGFIVRKEVVSFGEVGLAGEVRGVGRPDMRISEAVAMGFTEIICPASVTVKAPRGVKLHRVRGVREATAVALGCKVSEIRRPAKKELKSK